MRLGIILTLAMYFFSLHAPAQSLEQLKELPIMGDISEIKTFTKIYLMGATSDDRKMILEYFKRDKKSPFKVVADPADAEIFMNFAELSRQAVANNRSSAQQQRSELEVFYYNKDKRKVIVFTDTETLDVSNGFTFSAPNSWNLTRNFMKAYDKMMKKQ